MADARNVVDYNGIDYHGVTAKGDGSTILYDRTKAGGSVSVGLAVSQSADGTVQLASDGERIRGKLIRVEWDDQCTVQEDGYCTLPGGNAATLTRGSAFVGALGAASAKGYIRAVNTSVAAELALARGEIIANGTTTAVQVDLG